MFGYIKPLKSELKVCEHEYYKATYCGLCNALKCRYGVAARFFVNYDFTFLALLFDVLEQKNGVIEKKRCIASPIKKKCVMCQSAALDFSADASVILMNWHLRDAIMDKKFFKSLPYRVLQILSTPAYKCAKARIPWFEEKVHSCMEELWQLEKSKTQNIDLVADTFAQIISELSKHFEDNTHRKLSERLLYHIGRAIYLIDALYDMEKDDESGAYNPLLLCNIKEEEACQTIYCSVNAAIDEWNKAGECGNHDIVSNILSLGIPSIIAKKEKEENA